MTEQTTDSPAANVPAVRHLGELGRGAREPVAIVFDWFGHPIRVAEDAGDLPLIDFLATAKTISIEDEVGVMLATQDFIQAQLHPDDWATFLRVAKENRQTHKDLMQVAKDIVAAVARFPSGRLSDSSNGQPITDTSTRLGSTSVQRAMASLQGRPDLKMHIYLAQQARRVEEREALVAQAA